MSSDQKSKLDLPPLSLPGLARDLRAGVVVFLAALPLCLGIAVASNAEPIAGIIAGIIGGIVVGALSGSHTSVSGPAAGLTAIIATQLGPVEAGGLGTFEVFLLAVIVAGILQMLMGFLRCGGLSSFVPSSVIKGLLAAIGIILILKQIPHIFGSDTDPEGEMAFVQPDHENTFSAMFAFVRNIHVGALTIGLLSIAVIVLWDRVKFLKKSIVPAPLIVVALGIGLQMAFNGLGSHWAVRAEHLVQVPVAESVRGFLGFLKSPDYSQIFNPAVYVAGLTIAIVASLETLLNLEAVDRIDPRRRNSPPNRELVAQGAGNILAGFLGGLPMTSVIVRSSVNINAGGNTRFSAIFHGILLLVCVVFFPSFVNKIPMACLAAILLMTGIKLASPKLIKQMWQEGRYQFLPFLSTVVVIVFTDLLIGIVFGLCVAVAFILYSNLRRPLRKVVERHAGGEVLHLELANQVSFLNRAALERTLHQAPAGSHVLLDASNTDYIDPDVLSLIRDFKESVAPAHSVNVSLRGFKEQYSLEDEILYVDYSTRELQEQLAPAQALQVLMDGNERFRTGKRLSRDLARQVNATAAGQHPMAVILSCIDSRTPAELIFDMGLGDIFSCRIAGNVISPRVLGSIEYSTAVAGARLVMVVGHTRCGAVTAAVQQSAEHGGKPQPGPCTHVQSILGDVEKSIEMSQRRAYLDGGAQDRLKIVDAVASQNVQRMVRLIHEQSEAVQGLVKDRQVAIVGAMYDVATGAVEILPDACLGLSPAELEEHAADRKQFSPTT